MSSRAMTKRDHTVGRRAVVSAFGETPLDAIENHLRLEAQPPPIPPTLKPTDVIVVVKSAAVGWVDLLMTSGQYQHMPSPPYTPGMEYSGEVAWAGPEAGGWRVGDRVIVDGFAVGPRSSGDYQRWGGFATWAVAPANIPTIKLVMPKRAASSGAASTIPRLKMAVAIAGNAKRC